VLKKVSLVMVIVFCTLQSVFEPLQTWSEVKECVASRIVSFKTSDVRSLCEDKFLRTGTDDWLRLCEHGMKVEKEQWTPEMAIWT
jgi:hypothetical protein